MFLLTCVEIGDYMTLTKKDELFVDTSRGQKLVLTSRRQRHK